MQVRVNADGLRAVMEAESPSRKIGFAAQAALWMLFFGVSGGVYLAASSRAYKINEAMCNKDDPNVAYLHPLCADVNNNVYDIGALIWNKYSDEVEAAVLISEISKMDDATIFQGTRFTVIYTLCGITFCTIAASYLCLAAGAWSLWARMTGLVCGCLFGCVNLAALITTGVFRFNSIGKLAALSLCPTALSETYSV